MSTAFHRSHQFCADICGQRERYQHGFTTTFTQRARLRPPVLTLRGGSSQKYVIEKGIIGVARGANLIIIAPADILKRYGARPSTGQILTMKSDMFFMVINILYHVPTPGDVIQNGWQHFTKSRCTYSVNNRLVSAKSYWLLGTRGLITNLTNLDCYHCKLISEGIFALNYALRIHMRTYI